MTDTVDGLAPAGVNWMTAMTTAADILSDLKPHAKLMNPEVYSAKASLAQAWIAYAREITAHARAQGD